MDIVIEWIVRLMVWISAIRYDKYRPGERLKLLLVGYNGARNTGADARVVAVSMDNRLDGLFRDIGFAEKYLHHVNDKHLAQNVIQSLQEADANKESIINAINQHTSASRQMLKDMSLFLKQWLGTWNWGDT